MTGTRSPGGEDGGAWLILCSDAVLPCIAHKPPIAKIRGLRGGPVPLGRLAMEMFDLTGRTALVTGSSRGIGLALARGLAAAGAEVIVNGRDAERLAATADGLAAEGHAVRQAVFDVTDAEAVRTAIDGIEAEGRAIDILVNNAGMQHRGPLEEFPPEAFERLMRTNVTSVFLVAQAAARHMIARRRGRIVNIASIQAALARRGIAPYTASKGAVANLTKGMAVDWAEHGLCCNAIAPGYFATEMNAALTRDRDFSDWLAHRTPAGRWGQVEELVGVCVFLSSDAASFVTGQTIFVDGGMSISV